MKSKQMIFWTLLVLLTMTLWGCGSSRDSSGTATGSTDDVLANAQTLGVVNCTKCHSAATPETASWLESTHGNSNGSMRYGEEPHSTGSSCQPCHNQLLDGDKMEQAFPPNLQIGTDDGTPTGVPIFANVSRDIVTCESCHGGGQLHSGVGPIPYTRPDWEQCVACHDHEGKRHADDFGNLASNIGNSAHNNSDDLHASTTRCQRCHTAEGSVALSRFTGDSDAMHAADDVDPIDLEENLHAVTCAACHIPHDDSGRWEQFITLDYSLDTTGDGVADTDYTGNWDPNNSGTPDQFDFCTSCHTFYNQDGDMVGGSGNPEFYHATAWYRMIPTTHYDNPATGTGTTIEGYVIREDSASPCFDCHGHELRTNTRRSRDVAAADEETPQDYGYTIHTQWASSGHAGNLLDQKYAADPNGDRTVAVVDAVMAAGATEATGAAWVHYDWDDTGGTGAGGSARGECQMCHTATGAMNFLNDPSTYDPANNDFSHLDGWVAGGASSEQNELLYCWGCHENAQTGVLRNPGAIDRPYTVGGVAVSLPDGGSSNVCFNCHGARGNMEGYYPDPAVPGEVGVIEDPANDFSTLNAGFGPNTKNVTEAHYLVASATLYAADTRIGYEYSAPAPVTGIPTLLDYTPVSFFGHDSIMLNADVPETGSGPCVGCHMKTEGSHFFEVVEKDGAGVITGLNSTACVECHTGDHGAALVSEDGPLGTAAAAAAFLEAEAEGYHETLEILRVGLSALGIEFQSGYPYFNTTVAGSWINEGNFGAAHNYNYLHHEPGAYAHNRYYAKRLLFDSIDWVDNYVLDGSITVDAVTYPEAAHWLGADATTGVATRP
jgi:hypothetical protein